MFLPIGDDVDNRNLPVVGIFLILANVLVCAWEARIAFDDQSGRAIEAFFMTWGLVPADLPKGHVTGVLTHMFVHAGLMHLVGNMVVLWAFVHSLENLLGSLRMLGLYLVWGLAAAAAQTAMSWGDEIPLVGASGAIAGMIGAYWVRFGALTRITTLVWFFGVRRVRVPSGFYVFIWCTSQLSGVLAGEGDEGGGVAWYAHIGGFAAGLITMMLLRNLGTDRFVQTEDGTLRYEGKRGQDAEETTAPAEPLTACPYCSTPLDLDAKTSANFVKCASPTCQRLVFFDAPVGAAS
jgi:membrane associated rhomboid family serine protease